MLRLEMGWRLAAFQTFFIIERVNYFNVKGVTKNIYNAVKRCQIIDDIKWRKYLTKKAISWLK